MRKAVARDSWTVSRGPWPTEVEARRRWSAVHGPRTTDHDLLSASIESDAARLLHFPRAVLRAGTAVGLDRRQRGRRPAALLPAARGAPLRHVRANHGHESGPARRSEAGLFRALHLPALSRTRIFNADAGSCADGCAGQISHRTDTCLCFSSGTVAGLLSPEPHSRRARTSSNEPLLSFPLNKRP